MADTSKIIPALVAAQHATTAAHHDAVNPHFKSKYASLGAIWDACRPALEANGLAVVQYAGYDAEANTATLDTVLYHESGETLGMGTAAAPVDKPTAQGMGSALTYLRRYSLAAIMGIVTEDDDGTAASKKKAPEGITDEQRETLDGFLEGKEMTDKERLGLRKWMEGGDCTKQKAEAAVKRFRDHPWLESTDEEDEGERDRLLGQIKAQLTMDGVGSATRKTVTQLLEKNGATMPLDKLRETSAELFKMAAKGDK